MILFAILLSSGLDMNLPEFEPDTDFSGNYIVSGYDVSSGESIVEEVPVAELLESVVLRTEATAETQDVVDAIQTMNEDNNSYWELFLDSYPVEVSHHLRSSYKAPLTWRFTSAGLIDHAAATNGRIAYIPVQIGVSYVISDVTSGSGFTQNYRVGVVDNIDSPTQVTNFATSSDLFNGVTITPSMNGYLVFFMFNYTHEIGFTADWVTIEQESYTLSELGNAVMEIRSNNDLKFRILIFLTLINFAYPIVISSFKNFFGGGKNV